MAAVILAVFILTGTQGCKKAKVTIQPTPVPTATPQPKLEKIIFTFNGNVLWMDPDGNNRQEIFPDNTSKWFPSVSPDGWFMSYWAQSGKSYNLWIGDFKKRKAFQVTFDADGLDSDIQNFNMKNSTSWSADSQFVVYSRSNDIWKISRDGFDQVSLTDTHNCYSPALSKDNKLVYAVKESETTTNLYMKNIDSVMAEKLTNLLGKKAGSPSFSPDGQKIVFTIEDMDSINVYVTSIASKKEEPLTYDGKSNCPIFNHDGSKVIFSSYITDKYQPEIWSMSIDKSARAKLTSSGGVSPAWLFRVLAEPLPTATPVPPPGETPKKQEDVFTIKEGAKPAQAAATQLPAGMDSGTTAPETPAAAAPEVPAQPESLSVKTVQQGDKLLFYPVIHYDTALSNIKPEFFPVLDDMVKIMKAHNSPIVIEGHTDNVPIKSKRFKNNYELSLARANAVKKYLIDKHGIEASRISVAGFADKKPVVPNDTADNKYKNRRAEVMVIKISSNEPPAAVSMPAKTSPSAAQQPQTTVPPAQPTVMPTAAPVKVQVKSKSGKSTGW